MCKGLPKEVGLTHTTEGRQDLEQRWALVSVSDGKIKTTSLMLRRGALSNTTEGRQDLEQR